MRKKYKLGECLTLCSNGLVIKQKKGAIGVPITRIETLSGGSFNRDRLGYADIEDPILYAEYLLEDQDILMSHINSKEFLGRSVLYERQANEHIIHGMNLLRIRTNHKVLFPRYAAYIFQTSYFRKAIYNIRKDAIGQSSISITDLLKLSIECPSIGYQEKVIAVIAAIDQKTALNRSINHNLPIPDRSLRVGEARRAA